MCYTAFATMPGHKVDNLGGIENNERVKNYCWHAISTKASRKVQEGVLQTAVAGSIKASRLSGKPCLRLPV